jgi:RHS repeat-associated protein
VVSSNGNSVAQKFAFGGKELSEELGIQLHDFGARNYDASLGRWFNVDPMAHLRESLTPYNFVSNNPIMRIDPDGALDGDYYNFDGTYLGSDGVDDDKVYVVNSIDSETASKGMSSSDLLALRDKDFHSGSTDPSATLLPIKHSEFKAIAGTIYAEGTPWNLSFGEAAGIYSVMRNRASASGKSVYDIAGGGGIYGWSERSKINSSGAHKSSVNNAYRGTIEGLTNSKDYSGGGFYWHGSDFSKTTKGSHAYESYYKVGFNFTNSSHDIWNLGSTKSGKSGWDYKYQSTGAAGQTTFMKLTDGWIKANGYGGKW